MADFSDLDAGGTLLHAQDVLCRRREAEVADLGLVLRWADLHADDPREWPAERRFPGMARLVRVGGEGTPLVQDLPIAELAVSRQAHVLATRWVMADALDLRHRLPLCWEVLCSGSAEVWLGRRVARATRDLSPAEAGYVDAAVAPLLAGEQPSRVLEVLEAKVIEANPAAHAERVSAERARRYVSVGRVDEAGLRHVIARVEHGDAVWVDALVDRVADILAARDAAAGGPVRDRDLLRSVAFGWLARPAELLELLLSHQGETTPPATDTNGDAADADGDADAAPGATPASDEDAEADNANPNPASPPDGGPDEASTDPRHDDADDAGDPELDLGLGFGDTADAGDDEERASGGGSTADSDDAGDVAGEDAGAGGEAAPDPLRGLSQRLLELLGSRDLTRLRPQAVVYVHLHQAALVGHGPGVARIEDGGGPRHYDHLADLLGHARLRIQPVIDLNQAVSLDAYETPQWLRERIHLIRPADAFPHATTISRHVDIDHVEPFQHQPDDPDGLAANAPPGQSGLHNSAPLGRFHHRAKTHLGYRVRQPGPGTYVWRTPHNLYRLVDHTGTHPLDETTGHALLHDEATADTTAAPIHAAESQAPVDQDVSDGHGGPDATTNSTSPAEAHLRDTTRATPRSPRHRAPVQIIHTPGLVLDYDPAA